MCPPCDMTSSVIEGNAVLCFDESGFTFQGVIHAKDESQYAIYGTKSSKAMRKFSQALPNTTDSENLCGCLDEAEGPGIPVIYDIKVVDCEVGEEYSLRRVHGRNGENVTLRCKSVTFNTTQIYKGQRADMEAQKVIGHKMEGRRVAVYKGPIEMTVTHSLQKNRPWVL